MTASGQPLLGPGISAETSDAATAWWLNTASSEANFGALYVDDLRCNPPHSYSPVMEKYYQVRRENSLNDLRKGLFQQHQPYGISQISFAGSHIRVVIDVSSVYPNVATSNYIAGGDISGGAFRLTCFDPGYVQ